MRLSPLADLVPTRERLAPRTKRVLSNADLATNFGAGVVDLACCSFSGEVYEMASRLFLTFAPVSVG